MQRVIIERLSVITLQKGAFFHQELDSTNAQGCIRDQMHFDEQNFKYHVNTALLFDFR